MNTQQQAACHLIQLGVWSLIGGAGLGLIAIAITAHASERIEVPTNFIPDSPIEVKCIGYTEIRKIPVAHGLVEVWPGYWWMGCGTVTIHPSKISGIDGPYPWAVDGSPLVKVVPKGKPRVFDYDGDNDVDLEDYAKFQTSYTGPYEATASGYLDPEE